MARRNGVCGRDLTLSKIEIGLPELIGIIVADAAIVLWIAYLIWGRKKTSTFSGTRTYSCDLPSDSRIKTGSTVRVTGPTPTPETLASGETVEVDAKAADQGGSAVLKAGNESSVLVHPGAKALVGNDTYGNVAVQTIEVIEGVVTFVSSSALTGTASASFRLSPMGPGRKFLSRFKTFAIGASGTVWSIEAYAGQSYCDLRVYEGIAHIFYEGGDPTQPVVLGRMKKLRLEDETIPDPANATNL